jgi:hypothetical protein
MVREHSNITPMYQYDFMEAEDSINLISSLIFQLSYFKSATLQLGAHGSVVG